jgi:D-arabinose 1-dehydrogenase-like Zn-dependent alcohol dehydrogenase
MGRLDGAAPLLCASVTVYSPMMRHGLNAPRKHLGVVALGGLGHMAVKFGKAFGMTVTVVSSSPGKRQEVVERLYADAFLLSHDPEQMKAARRAPCVSFAQDRTHDLATTRRVQRQHNSPYARNGTSHIRNCRNSDHDQTHATNHSNK